jgi:hypothetical protein
MRMVNLAGRLAIVTRDGRADRTEVSLDQIHRLLLPTAMPGGIIGGAARLPNALAIC